MIVEVVAVGTELLLGQIINGNGAHIGAALAEQGFDANHQQVVGDNLGRMTDVLLTAFDRSDAVIVTGGIGPTQDDITREAICAATGRPMLRSSDYVAQLQSMWERRGRIMPASNVRQADYPKGAELLPNPRGSAPGLVLDHHGTLIFALPGVPAEMHLLLSDQVMPRLRAKAGIDEVLISRVLRLWGRSESEIADTLDDLFGATTNPSLAFLASSGEIKVRITAKADTVVAAAALIGPVETEVRSRFGDSVFGVDEEAIEPVVLGLLRQKGWTVGSAESITGGAVATRLTSIAGASDVFRGSIVAYAADLKADLLAVDVSDGVVTEAVAVAMAEGARSALGVDVAVATTGSAGPDPLERDIGTVIVGVATPDGARARTLQLPGDRERIRAYGTTAALQLLRLGVAGSWWGS